MINDPKFDQFGYGALMQPGLDAIRPFSATPAQPQVYSQQMGQMPNFAQPQMPPQFMNRMFPFNMPNMGEAISRPMGSFPAQGMGARSPNPPGDPFFTHTDPMGPMFPFNVPNTGGSFSRPTQPIGPILGPLARLFGRR